MTMHMVEMPDDLSEEEQNAWIKGFNSGMDFTYKHFFGDEVAAPVSNFHVIEMDDDGISDRPIQD